MAEPPRRAPPPLGGSAVVVEGAKIGEGEQVVRSLAAAIRQSGSHSVVVVGGRDDENPAVIQAASIDPLLWACMDALRLPRPAPLLGPGSPGLRASAGRQASPEVFSQRQPPPPPPPPQQQQRQGQSRVPATLLSSITQSLTSWRGSVFSSPQRNRPPLTMAEAMRDVRIRSAPIVDITVVFGNEAAPPGYFKISETVGGHKADLNQGCGAHATYLCVRKGQSSLLPRSPSSSSSSSSTPSATGEAAGDERHRAGAAASGSPGPAELPPVVALCVVLPERNEFVPPGFSVLRRRDKGCGPVDLNYGTPGETVYLCIRRARARSAVVANGSGSSRGNSGGSSDGGSAPSKGGSASSLQDVLELDDVSLLSDCPITDIQMYVPSKGEVAGQALRYSDRGGSDFSDFGSDGEEDEGNFILQAISHTPLGDHRANLNASSGGASIYIGYRRDTSVLLNGRHPRAAGGGKGSVTMDDESARDGRQSTGDSSGGGGLLYTNPPKPPVVVVPPTVAPPAAPATPTAAEAAPAAPQSSDLAGRRPLGSLPSASGEAVSPERLLVDALVAAPESADGASLAALAEGASRNGDGAGGEGEEEKKKKAKGMDSSPRPENGPGPGGGDDAASSGTSADDGSLGAPAPARKRVRKRGGRGHPRAIAPRVRRRCELVDASGRRAAAWRQALVHPLLLALVTDRRPAVCLAALEGLQALLVRHHFFADDMQGDITEGGEERGGLGVWPRPGNDDDDDQDGKVEEEEEEEEEGGGGGDGRRRERRAPMMTLLELAITCVVDHLSLNCYEPHFPYVLAFLRSAIAATDAKFSLPTVRTIFNGFVFCCAFTASAEATRNARLWSSASSSSLLASSSLSSSSASFVPPYLAPDHNGFTGLRSMVRALLRGAEASESFVDSVTSPHRRSAKRSSRPAEGDGRGSIWTLGESLLQSVGENVGAVLGGLSSTQAIVESLLDDLLSETVQMAELAHDADSLLQPMKQQSKRMQQRFRNQITGIAESSGGGGGSSGGGGHAELLHHGSGGGAGVGSGNGSSSANGSSSSSSSSSSSGHGGGGGGSSGQHSKNRAADRATTEAVEVTNGITDSFWRRLFLVTGARIFPSEVDGQRLMVVLGALSALGVMTPYQPLSSVTSVAPSVGGRGDQSRLVVAEAETNLALKVLSLATLNEVLRGSGERVSDSKRWGFLVRRFVVSVLLANVDLALREPRVLRELLRTLTTLWRRFRTHCKVELAVIVEEVLLRILKSSGTRSAMEADSGGGGGGSSSSKDDSLAGPSIDVQRAVLSEVATWLDAQHAPEIFLNFDLDRGVLSDLTIYEHLCATVCTIAEGMTPRRTAGAVSSSWLAGDSSGELAAFRLQALDVVAQIMRILFNISGHAHIMHQSQRVRDMSLKGSGTLDKHSAVQVGGGWEEDGSLLALVQDEQNALSIMELSESDLLADSDEEGAGDDGDPERPAASSPSKPAAADGVEPVSPFSPTPAVSTTPNSANPPPPSLLPLGVTPASPSLNVTGEGGAGGGNIDTSVANDIPDASAPSKPDSSLGSTSSRKTGRKRAQSLQQQQQQQQQQPTKKSEFQLRQQARKASKQLLTQGLELYQRKGLSKAIDFWVAKNFLSDSPRDIAAFLRLYHKHFSPDEIGDFLGSGETPEADAIRMSFCSVISFRGLSVEQALRHFLTSSHFRLPGEAQKVDRLISTFAQCWWDDNARVASSSSSSSSSSSDAVEAAAATTVDPAEASSSSSSCSCSSSSSPSSSPPAVEKVGSLRSAPRDSLGSPLGTGLLRNSSLELSGWMPDHVDTVFLLAFAVIMLNTDLHRAQSKKHRKMTREEFTHNLARSDPINLPRPMLQEIYDSIQHEQIQMPIPGETTNGGGGGGGGGGGSSGGGKTKAGKRGSKGSSGDGFDDESGATFAGDVRRAVMRSEELLRTYAIYQHKFFRLGIDTNVSIDVVRSMFLNVWWMVHSMLNSVLGGGVRQLPGSAATQCLDILQSAIAASIFLGLRKERRAFVLQLAHLKSGLLSSSSSGGGGESGAADVQQEEWFVAIEQASSAGGTDAIANLMPVMMELRRSFEERTVQTQLREVAARIEGGATKHRLLDDPERVFLREGDLLKKSNRSGKHVSYHFFLFSDVLVYTHRASFGSQKQFRVHKVLPLSLLKIANVDFAETSGAGGEASPDMKTIIGLEDRAFHILHPLKSFVVIADLPQSKALWMRVIDEAIRVARPQARPSAADSSQRPPPSV